LVIPFFDDITLRNRRLDIEAIYVKMRPVARLGWNVNEALDPGRMLWYKSVPTIVALARRLWSVKVWSPADVKLGNAITKYLRLYGGPSWEFLTGDDSSNRLQLEAVVAWYRAEVRKTASYASMVGFPDVAYVGLSHNDPVPLSNAIVQKLDNETELRWAKVERPIEPWVVQCVHLGKPIWARVISAEPRPSVVDVMLDEASVDALGSYGWRVNFRVKWGHGRDAAFLYVGANRSFLFYVIQD
jgi:hypothetical protein